MSPEHLRLIVISMIALILSVTVHEFGHAFVADKLGDRLPRSQGRVTLSPLAHADPIGTIAVPLFAMFFLHGLGFGWGRPVMVSPLSFSRRFHMRTAHMMVALAGPVMNILFAIVISVITMVIVRAGWLNNIPELYVALLLAIQLNFVLAIFNLVPLPPLDGSTVIVGIVPAAERVMDALRPYAIFCLMALVALPWVNRVILLPAEWLFHFWCGSLLGLPGT